MGALYLCIYNSSKTSINIEFTKSFMSMKSRGPDDTQLLSESTPIINQMNMHQISSILSKREMKEYKSITFNYGYHRMSVNDLSIDGSQPFEDPIINKMIKYPEIRSRPKRRLICNGEIYNYNELLENHKFSDRDLQSQSDVEIILPLYIKYTESITNTHEALEKCVNELDGEFSFVLTENTNSFNLKKINVFAVRDIFGTKPLYMVKYIPKNGIQTQDIFYLFVSEIKSIPNSLLVNSEYVIMEVPPGTYWSYQNSVIEKNGCEFIPYYNFDIYKNLDMCSINKANPEIINDVYFNIKDLLTKSVVQKYSLCDKEGISVGVLLSGGFDSCIILSILIKYLSSINHNFENEKIHVFTIGDNDNTDITLAKSHVESLEKEYSIDIHLHIVNIQDLKIIIPEIDNIIEILETYDDLTIKKSIPMLFLLKYIKNMTDVRILLSGEGLDELCGYSEFFDLSDIEFQNKSIELLKHLSKYDLLRSDKLAGSLGLEIRYPFLNKPFVEYILSIHPKLKRPQISGYSKTPIEKYIIRKSFDDVNTYYMDTSILWNRQQSIDKSFKYLNDYLTTYFDSIYSDTEFYIYLQQVKNNNINLPLTKTKEQMHYKNLFNKKYPNSYNILNYFWESLWN
jgi:asparagine synthase (glutamine-hydrolysing)